MINLYYEAIVITLGVATAMAMLLLVFGGLVMLLDLVEPTSHNSMASKR